MSVEQRRQLDRETAQRRRARVREWLRETVEDTPPFTPFSLESLRMSAEQLRRFARPSSRDRLQAFAAAVREGRWARTVASRTAWTAIGYGVALAAGGVL